LVPSQQRFEDLFMAALQASYPRALACGDSGVSVEFGDQIHEEINDLVLALDASLASAPLAGIIETVPTFRALMIHYDPVEVSYDRVSSHVMALAASGAKATNLGRYLRIPVCYEAEYGVDVDRVCREVGLTLNELIDIHTLPEYRVFMLGFMPGFAYLGGTNPILSLPRCAKPRHGAPAGTISIAAGQCAVHAVEGPSGWHWIGRTPVQTIQDGAVPKFAIRPGDKINFYPISPSAWRTMRDEVLAGVDLLEVLS
jgi:KipI family sensor histidine kinase inhibitor